MKFLLKNIGLDSFKELLIEEQKAIENKSYPIDHQSYPQTVLSNTAIPVVEVEADREFEQWKSTNVTAQKQNGLFAVGVKVQLGDFYTDKARLLADLVEKYAAGEIRLSLRQNILIPFVREEAIPFFYQELKKNVESCCSQCFSYTNFPSSFSNRNKHNIH